MMKSCPLCGHDPDLFDVYRRSGNEWWVSVECTCGISYDTEVFAETFEEAVKLAEGKWGRRCW